MSQPAGLLRPGAERGQGEDEAVGRLRAVAGEAGRLVQPLVADAGGVEQGIVPIAVAEQGRDVSPRPGKAAMAA